jgi:hypothetical protein
MIQNKKHLRPLSYRQAWAIECWLKNRRKSKAQALREAGYGKSIIHQPHKVFSSPAVQRELDMRGYGRYGIANGQVPEEEEFIEPAPKIDFSALTPEKLQILKQRLADAPDINYYPPIRLSR